MAAAARYRIGEFAYLSGVTATTLRFYDRIGLFRPSGVDPLTQYRYYLPRQLEELASILALKHLGVSLAGLRGFVRRARSTEECRVLLNALKNSLEQSVQTARRSLDCINAALQDLEAGKPPISVVVKRRPAISVASIRATVKRYEDIIPFEEELLRALPPQSIGEMRGVLWHRCADSGSSLECETFVVLRQPVPTRRFYNVKQLPPSTLACAYSGLDDKSAEQAYIAVQKWMNISGYRLAGPKRELYLRQMLEIQFPMTSA